MGQIETKLDNIIPDILQKDASDIAVEKTASFDFGLRTTIWVRHLTS
jgi:hypothetical protein